MSLASTNSTPSSSLLINANQNQGIILNDSADNSGMVNVNKMQSSNGQLVVPRMNPLANMENNQHNQIDLNKNNTNGGGGLLSIQSSNSLISSSVSSLSSSSSVSSSHSSSLSQDELQFNEYNSQPTQLKYHHNHHHHSHHHHPYLTQHHLNQQHQQGQLQHNANNNNNNTNNNNISISSNQEHSSIQLSLQNLNTLKSLTDYQQKVEYLLKLTPIPSGWQKSQTDTGEIFFINHSTRSTCWDPRLKIVESYLQKHEQALHEQQQQHNHIHGLEFNPLSPNLHHTHHNHHHHHQSIPMYQQQMNNSRSNSTGAVSSSSCTSSNSASPLFMLNSSGSAANNVILMNSNNSMVSAASNEIMGIENGLVQQQQQQKMKEFPDMLETNGETNFQHQERIKTLIDIITKKKELIKSLNELNKKVRTQILSRVNGRSFILSNILN